MRLRPLAASAAGQPAEDEAPEVRRTTGVCVMPDATTQDKSYYEQPLAEMLKYSECLKTNCEDADLSFIADGLMFGPYASMAPMAANLLTCTIMSSTPCTGTIESVQQFRLLVGYKEFLPEDMKSMFNLTVGDWCSARCCSSATPPPTAAETASSPSNKKSSAKSVVQGSLDLVMDAAAASELANNRAAWPSLAVGIANGMGIQSDMVTVTSVSVGDRRLAAAERQLAGQATVAFTVTESSTYSATDITSKINTAKVSSSSTMKDSINSAMSTGGLSYTVSAVVVDTPSTVPAPAPTAPDADDVSSALKFQVWPVLALAVVSSLS